MNALKEKVVVREREAEELRLAEGSFSLFFLAAAGALGELTAGAFHCFSLFAFELSHDQILLYWSY